MNDLINRNAAIAAFKPYALYDSNRTNVEWVRRIELVLEALPSAEKHGKWIHRMLTTYPAKAICVCNLCGQVMDGEYSYCPRCGANMERS